MPVGIKFKYSVGSHKNVARRHNKAMPYFSIINSIKRTTDSLTKQSQKNLITAVMTGLGMMLSVIIGFVCAPGLAGLENYQAFALTVSLAAAILVPAAILIAHRIWDWNLRRWLQSDDFITQRKFSDELYRQELNMLKTLEISRADKMKERRRIYGEFQERNKALEARYINITRAKELPA